MSQPICTERCWTAVPCPECGNSLPPRGRSVPLEMNTPMCCEKHARDPTINPRHSWDIHDSERSYMDPEGWKAHLAECAECRGE